MQVDCLFKYKEALDRTMKYFCIVQSVNINSYLTNIKSFVGDHEVGKSNNEVEGISFEGTVVEYFPRRLDKHFPNLTSLRIVSCGLKVIRWKDLKGLEDLTELYLVGNQLKSLPNNLFTDMKSLKFIMLQSNKLQYLSSRLLDPIDKTQLRQLELSSNTRIDSYFNKNAAYSLDTVMKIIDEKCLNVIEHDETLKVNFPKEIKELYGSKRLSDFTIIVGGREFFVHKIVLATQSSVFSVMFETDMQEKIKNQMIIEDMSVKAFDKFLCYVYTGKIPDVSDVWDVFTIAVKYNVENLKTVCETIILDNVDESNALEICCLAYLYDLEDIKLLAISELSSMFPELLLSHHFIENPSYVKRVIEAKYKIALAQQELDEILQNKPEMNELKWVI